MLAFDTKNYDINSERDLVADGAVVLKKREGRTLKSGGLWVYDNEIAQYKGSFEDGDLIAVEDFDGYFMGYGFVNRKSKITVRVLSRHKEQPVTPAFLTGRVRSAWEYRKKVIDTSSCRLIFGEADRMPGLTVDKFGPVLVSQTLSLGMEKWKDTVFAELLSVLSAHGQEIRGIYERNDARSRTLEGLERSAGFWETEFDPNVRICENGLFYEIDVSNGQKTGYFLDQRFNRLSIRPMAKGARVLDCFCNAGGFALNALAGGAAFARGVDASEQAVESATENAEINGFSDRSEFVSADIFEYLPALVEQGEKYDLVILDPPAFAKSRASVKTALRGYREINRRGMQLVRDGGFLATCTCSHFITPELFDDVVFHASRDAHVRLRLVEKRAQSPDHPVLLGADESAYLKFLLFQVQYER